MWLYLSLAPYNTACYHHVTVYGRDNWIYLSMARGLREDATDRQDLDYLRNKKGT